MDNARYQRFTKDACLIREFLLPAAGATATSDFLDLGNAEIGPLVREFDVEIAVQAAPALADAKEITFTLKDSDDGVTFAPVPYIAPFVIVGDPTNEDGPNLSAKKIQFGLSTSIRRYLALSATVDVDGGDSTAVNASLALVF